MSKHPRCVVLVGCVVCISGLICVFISRQKISPDCRDVKVVADIELPDGKVLSCSLSRNEDEILYSTLGENGYHVNLGVVDAASGKVHIKSRKGDGQYHNVSWIALNRGLVEERVYGGVRGKRGVYCINLRNDQEMWYTQLDGSITCNFGVCANADMLFVATEKWPGEYNASGDLFCVSANTGERLSSIYRKRRKFTKLTVSDDGHIIMAVDDDGVCDIFVNSESSLSKVGYDRRRIDDVLFGKPVDPELQRGIAAISPSGRFGAYSAGDTLFVFSLKSIAQVSEEFDSDRTREISPNWRASVVATFAGSKLGEKRATRELLWDRNDRLYVMKDMLHCVGVTGSVWRTLDTWKIPLAPLERKMLIGSNRLLLWDNHAIRLVQLRR